MVFSQSEIDSLKSLYNVTKTDTVKVTLLNKIAAAYEKIDSGKLAIEYAKQALEVAKTSGDPKKIAESNMDVGDRLWNSGQTDSAIVYLKLSLKYYEKQASSKQLVNVNEAIADIYRDKAQYPLANETYLKALFIARSLKDSTDMQSIYYGIGMIYTANDQYELARQQCMLSVEIALRLKHYMDAIKAYTVIGNSYAKQGISAASAKAYFAGLDINSKYLHIDNVTGVIDIDLGNVYNDMKDSANAMKYYRESLQIFIKLKNPLYQSNVLENMGNVYLAAKDYKKAEVYELKAMEGIKGTGDKLNIAICYDNVADFYNHTQQYDKALEDFNLALEMQQEIGDKEGIVYSTAGISEVYENKGDNNNAQKFGVESFNNARDIQILGQVRDQARRLSGIYDKLHQSDKAFYYYKQYVVAKDSLDNKEEAKKLINAELSHEYEQKQQVDKLEAEKQKAVAFEHEQHEKVIRNIYLVAFMVVLFLTGLLFRNLLRIRKSNRIITEQKIEVEKQKLIVDEKNKDITDSIRYASRIQRALLTSHEYINKHVNDQFIMFKPRDIVSGDFYWAFHKEEGQDIFYMACCDCTGHGVPGAFMSLLNISMLNESIIERKIAEPDKVLNEIRDNIIKALNPGKTDSESKDGMDCVLCAFDFKNMNMHLACANNPVWIITKAGEFTEINPDKMPVGIQYGDQKPFTLHSIKLNEGDIVYMFTDGYADQFGGPKGKKFKYKQLQDIVMANAQKPMREQKSILESTFSEWMGGLEQIDDVLVIGIKV